MSSLNYEKSETMDEILRKKSSRAICFEEAEKEDDEEEKNDVKSSAEVSNLPFGEEQVRKEIDNGGDNDENIMIRKPILNRTPRIGNVIGLLVDEQCPISSGSRRVLNVAVEALDGWVCRRVCELELTRLHAAEAALARLARRLERGLGLVLDLTALGRVVVARVREHPNGAPA